MPYIKHFISALILCAAVILSSTITHAAKIISQDNKAAVIMVYQRVGEHLYPSTNIQTEQFAAHIQEIVDGDYNVLPLNEIVTALKEDRPLPPRTIAITFDGAYSSILDDAVSLLFQYEIPFTIFVPTNKIQDNITQYLSWHALKKLAKNRLITIGLHPASYTRLANDSSDEIKRQINNARAVLRDKLDTEAQLFAYPFGEYSKAYRDIIEENGFTAAFGQQSSVANPSNDILALPRFAMTENYGSLDRFRLTANALPLPVSSVYPADPHLTKTHQQIGFTVEEELKGQLEQLSCFASGQDKPQIEIISENRIELKLAQPLEEGRTRINCTLPGPAIDPETNEGARWRWFGMLMTVEEN